MYAYAKVVREKLLRDGSSEKPHRLIWGVRNVVTGRWVATGEATHATMAQAEADADAAALEALASAEETQPVGAADVGKLELALDGL
jgi:hypothetical protein